MAREGTFVLGLLGNCISSWGMLAGLQRSGSTARPRRVGLIWIDAHGEFNTPETTLSGWLGGMPVSVAAGQSLGRMRTMAGLELPVATVKSHLHRARNRLREMLESLSEKDLHDYRSLSGLAG